MRAIQITEYGGPDVLRLRELPDPEPGDGELLVETAACGSSTTRSPDRAACRSAWPDVRWPGGLRLRPVRAIQITEYGGPDVLRLRELPDPEPGDGELLVQTVA